MSHIPTAELPQIEADDWVAAVSHYLPLLRASIKALDAQLKTARNARKMALGGLFNKFSLFPEGNEAHDAPEDFDMGAYIAAMAAAKGDRWERHTAKITDGFMLKA